MISLIITIAGQSQRHKMGLQWCLTISHNQKAIPYSGRHKYLKHDCSDLSWMYSSQWILLAYCSKTDFPPSMSPHSHCLFVFPPNQGGLVQKFEFSWICRMKRSPALYWSSSTLLSVIWNSKLSVINLSSHNVLSSFSAFSRIRFFGPWAAYDARERRLL